MLEKDLYAWDKVIKTARTSFINIENIGKRKGMGSKKKRGTGRK